MKFSKHGMWKAPEYRTWIAMKGRCYNPKNVKYSYYGERGIAVAPEWLHDFEAFYTYIGPKPSPLHSLDRIEPDGDYEPGNVRWATRTTQSINQRIRNTNKSGFRGVNWRKDTQKWAAYISFGYKSIYLGQFDNKIEAAMAYDQGALRYHGEHAQLNFPL